jgi:hypothetical protein
MFEIHWHASHIRCWLFSSVREDRRDKLADVPIVIRHLRHLFLLANVAGLFPAACHAVEMRLSSDALERTLQAQLFAKDSGFYYLRGNAQSPCFVVADSPHISFTQERVVVHMHVHAKLGTSIRGQCLGINLSRDVDVSLVPEAQGETIGFRDARIDKLSGSRELDSILLPFLSHRVPSGLKMNAADQLRQLLSKSTEATGYPMTLDRLFIHSMSVQGDSLVVDVDGTISVK